MRTRILLGLLAIAALAPTGASAQAARRPYVQLVTETSGIIAWRSTATEPSRVCYGDSPLTLSQTAGSGAAERDHAVRIEGLSSSETVYYTTAAASCPPPGPGFPDEHFTTAPPRGGEAPFRAWIVGDSGTGGADQAQVRDAMLAHTATTPIDLFLHLGDMAYTAGTTSEFDTGFFAPYQDVMSHVPVWATLGNHEGATSDSASGTGPYYEAYVLPSAGEAGGLPSGTEAYYAFDWGNVHFVVLDSHESPRTPGGAMLRWLDMDLAATDQEWIVAFFHHPPYTHGSHNSDLEGQLREIRENVVPILEAHAVDLVLTGHSHIYERSFLVRGAFDTPTTAGAHIVDPGDGQLDGDGAYESGPMGSVHIVAGHGGTGVSGAGDHPLMFFSEVENGSCLLDVRGSLLTVENLRMDGAITDHVALSHREGPFLLFPRGREQFLAGSSIDVTWGWAGAAPPANVSLEISVDDGGSWAPLSASTPNDGSERVTLPMTFTDLARIRLAPAASATPSDTSGAFSLVARATITAIPFGSGWEYSDDGTDPGAGFHTGAGGPYPEGPGELGFGDSDEATVLDRAPIDPTVLFRRRLPINARVVRAVVRARYDDGIAVMVNGTEVLRRDMDNGLAFDALASGGGDDNEMVTLEIPLDPVSPFVMGDNWISAIVKQNALSSSDLSFDLSLELDIEVEGAPPFDAGPRFDASRADGGPETGPSLDAAGMDAGSGAASGGCGCRAPSRSRTPLPWLTLLALGLLLGARARSRRP